MTYRIIFETKFQKDHRRAYYVLQAGYRAQNQATADLNLHIALVRYAEL